MSRARFWKSCPEKELPPPSFEISSMPEPIQLLTYLFTARYFVTSLQTLFLAGDIWPLLLATLAAMAVIGADQIMEEEQGGDGLF